MEELIIPLGVLGSFLTAWVTVKVSAAKLNERMKAAEENIREIKGDLKDHKTSVSDSFKQLYGRLGEIERTVHEILGKLSK